jgi:hypothetical protein
MLMKVVTVVPIFAGVAASANPSLAGTRPIGDSPGPVRFPIREPFMQPNAATSRSASIRYEDTFSRHAHPLSLSHTELLRMR